MNLRFHAEKISGAADGHYLNGVFAKHITFEEGGSGLFVFCALAKLDDAQTGANFASVLHDVFESDLGKLVGKREEILTELIALRTSGGDTFGQSGLNVDFVLVVFYKNAVYLARQGDRVQACVIRPPKSFDIKFTEGSGIVRDGDLVLISTSKFVETFDSNVLATDKELVFADAIDGLATDLSVLENQSEIGAIFVQVEGSDHSTAKVNAAETEESVEADVPVPVSDTHDSQENVAQDEVGVVRRGSVFGKIVPAIFAELGRLRIGDIGAIFRLRRNLVLVVVILILALAGSGYMTIRGEMDAKKEAQFEEYMTGANSKYSEAVGIVDLNKARARELLIEAGRSVDMALEVMSEDAEALALKAQIEGKLAETANLSTVGFSTFFDGGDKVFAVSRGSDSFYVFGEEGIVEVDDSGEEIDKLTDVGATSGFVYDDNVFSVVDGKVSRIPATSQAVEIATAPVLRDMAVFLGNVYVLGGDQIYKYVPIADGYAKSVDYLEQAKSFEAESRMAIDGSVWVTFGAEIFKYTRGVGEAFEISGVSGIGTLGEIYTNSDIDNLYVVDRTNSALLVVSKDGIMNKSYNSGEFAKATDLYVDEEAGKMYIGSGTKVLVADL